MNPAPPIRRCCVIDASTEINAEATALSERWASTSGRWSGIEKIAAVAMLSFDEQVDTLEVSGLTMKSWNSHAKGEARLIKLVERTLPPLAPGSRLISFDGGVNELVTLRHRAMGNWLIDVPRIHGWTEAGADMHLQLGTWWSNGTATGDLTSVCASLSIETRMLHAGQSVSLREMVHSNEANLVATFLLYLHRSALLMGSPQPLIRGWTALAAHLDAEGAVPMHLAPYARHPRIRAERKVQAHVHSHRSPLDYYTATTAKRRKPRP